MSQSIASEPIPQEVAEEVQFPPGDLWVLLPEEEMQQQAEQERQRAEQAEQELERLRSQLRSQGIEPVAL